MTIESKVNLYIKREYQVAPQPSLGPLTVTVTGPVVPYRPAMAHTGPGRCELNARHSSRVSVVAWSDCSRSSSSQTDISHPSHNSM